VLPNFSRTIQPHWLWENQFFSSYIRKLRMVQLQSHLWVIASSYMVKYLRIASYRKPFLIYEISTAPYWISLYLWKILFSFLSVQSERKSRPLRKRQSPWEGNLLIFFISFWLQKTKFIKKWHLTKETEVFCTAAEFYGHFCPDYLDKIWYHK